MASYSDLPAEDNSSARATVSTIQSVRSSIWSVPAVSDGQLNVGGATTSGTSTSMDTSPNSSPTSSGLRKRVVVKQIAPRQHQPPPTVSPAKSATTPSMANLAQLWSQLTPDQAQDLLKSLQQQSSAQGSAGTSHIPLAATTTTQPGHVSGPAHQVRGTGAKPIMPKAPRIPPVHRHSRGGHPAAFKGTAVHSGGVQAVGVQRVVAPVAVPPTGPRTGPHSGVRPQSSHYQAAGVPKDPSPSPSALPLSTHKPVITTSKPRKPCNCKNSQCLKLYCDCFANGEFCRDGCHCLSCKNNIQHADDRARAVKTCLDRNPHAFKPKVGQNKAGDERRHIKGCNCKRSGCLKNYCECYEAKIPCSGMCRCVGCKNVPDKLESKSLMHLADAADIRTQQQLAASSHFMEQLELTSSRPQPTTMDGQRLPFSFINKEVAKATCLCLLEEASHALVNGKPFEDVECSILDEFGRCMKQIINSAQSANEEGNRRHMVVH